MPALLEALAEPDLDPDVEDGIADVIAGMGADVHAAAPALLHIAASRDETPEGNGMTYALGKMGLSVLPALRQALGNEDPVVRRHALLTLRMLAGDGARVGYLVMPFLDDEAQGSRAVARETISGRLWRLRTAMPRSTSSCSSAGFSAGSHHPVAT